jgi:hypothetical protein
MYTCQTNSTNYQNKIFVRTQQIIWTAENNMYTCQTNSTNYPNKTYVRAEQITWTVRKNSTNYQNTKHL